MPMPATCSQRMRVTSFLNDRNVVTAKNSRKSMPRPTMTRNAQKHTGMNGTVCSALSM